MIRDMKGRGCWMAIAPFVFLAACGGGARESESATPSTPPNPPSGPPIAGTLTRSEIGAPADARCLPVVAADCGCTYACGIGWSTDGGAHYTVRHRFWDSGRSVLNARVDRHCVGTDCTDAFLGEIVCSAVCTPHPADATCHFEGDACIGSALAP